MSTSKKELSQFKTTGLTFLWFGIAAQIGAFISHTIWFEILMLFSGFACSFLSGLAFHLWQVECDKVAYAEAQKAEKR